MSQDKQPHNTSASQKADLFRTLWEIANTLRGSLDGWDFKTYVLGMLFYRFISENTTQYIALHSNRHYPDMDDELALNGKKSLIEEKGFYIPPSHLFCNVVKNAPNHQDTINEILKKVFTDIEQSAIGTPSEHVLKGLFYDIDVNSQKLGNTVIARNKKLIALLQAIANLPLTAGDFHDNSIDLFGDAYEYLMTMYASQAGKSWWEFFTPQEVSELLARITTVGKTSVNKVYDPACGSGSLLLKFAKILGQKNVVWGFYGQEINLTTYNLARINMCLHNIPYTQFNISHGDTLLHPAQSHQDEEPFEAIVSNPPYSIKWEWDSNPDLINDPRFTPAGILAPKTKADLAFTMHILSWLAPNGTAAIVEFPGILYRDGAEQKIRQYMVDNNFVDAVIQLPGDLFFGVSISTCILILKKSKKNTTDIVFIDASELKVRDGNKNKLTPEHIDTIMDTYTNRIQKENFSLVIPYETVKESGYNLSVSNYIQPQDSREEEAEDLLTFTQVSDQIRDCKKRIQDLDHLIDSQLWVQ